jgi:hypothetical protein
MSTTTVATPTSLLRFGRARADITPPVGVYHRMWGAARHDRATGVHRPLFGSVMALGRREETAPAMLRVHVDMVGLAKEQHKTLTRLLSEAADVAPEQVAIIYSHTHSGGVFRRDRMAMPGGELIAPHLERVGVSLADACRQAIATMQPATISYAAGRCDLAANRDYWDEARHGYVCGLNPDSAADDTVLVGRVTDAEGRTIAVIVNYACHPTTLAWENTLISPDYVGALREVVERESGAPCIFALGACGDLGPRHGFVGDPAVADQNGRQLGYAALAALASLGPPQTDFRYVGPVISGATLGVWAHEPFSAERREQASLFSGGARTVELPLKPRPDEAQLNEDVARWESRQREADQGGDRVAARDFGARAERARRWLGRLADLPIGSTVPFPYSVYRLGDAFWVTSDGEPYNLVQRELRRRFPQHPVLFSPLDGGQSGAYLLPVDRYGAGLYQEEASSFAPGCLEMLIAAIATQMAACS